MHRRQFLGLAMGTLAAGVVAGCASRIVRQGMATSQASSAPTDAAAWHAARRFASTRFGNIAYVERGSGPAALFLHGFPLNSFQWRGAFDRLSPYRRCVAPDSLGLGYTQVAEGQSVTPADQVDMLVTLLDKLSIGSVDLIANDSGGAVAQLFVTRHPERVRTLLLTNCDVENNCPPPAVLPVIELAHAGRFADEWLAPWVADKSLARSDKGLGGMTFTYPDRLADETIDMYLHPLVESSHRKALTNAYAIGLAPNPLAGVEPALKRCAVPTRILWGTGDDIFSKDDPDYLDKTLPRSRGVRRIEGAKLFFPEEFPDVVAEEARRLWDVG
ncbi:alpha/beta fold hydrolase [Dyella subtropica]|uniref:alpha/beta fold hydrolase n=1 Tax=Dyella subtropica TaxID=2992127 RepID=UPI00224E9F71|nr:alpha/beta hydrolase [Dyella subtropica]